VLYWFMVFTCRSPSSFGKPMAGKGVG